MKIFGQTLDTSILDTIRTEAASAFSRSDLARKVSEVLGWKGANGKPKEMNARLLRRRWIPSLADDGGAVRRSSFGARSTRDPAGRDKRRVPAVERALFAVLLSGEGAAVRGPYQVSGEEPRAGGRGRRGLLVGLLEGGGPGTLDRMGRGGPAEEPREGGEQQPLPDPAAHPRVPIWPRIFWGAFSAACHPTGSSSTESGRFWSRPLWSGSASPGSLFRTSGSGSGRGRQRPSRRCSIPSPTGRRRSSGEWTWGGARLNARCRILAHDFYARPQASIPQAC